MKRKTKFILSLGVGAATLAGLVIYLYADKGFGDDYDSLSEENRLAQHAEYCIPPRR